MGKIKDAIQDWLEDYGYDLGYDMSNYPDMVDWDVIKRNNIQANLYYSNKKAIEQEELSRKYGFPEPEVEND
jgi:hypothetical protein